MQLRVGKPETRQRNHMTATVNGSKNSQKLNLQKREFLREEKGGRKGEELEGRGSGRRCSKRSQRLLRKGGR